MVGVLTGEAAASHQMALQRIVLRWDYFHLYAQAQAEAKAWQERKRKRENVEMEEGEGKLFEVPLTFESTEEYLKVFEPLLLEECQAQILRGREDPGGNMGPQMSVATKCELANEFYFAVVLAQPEVVATFNENDLILFSKENPLGGSSLPSTYSMAIVEARESKTSLRFRLSLCGEDESEAATWTPAQQIRTARMRTWLGGVEGSPCWILNLCNLSTITREFTALRSSPSLPFFNTILNATVPPEEEDKKGQLTISPALMTALEANHNEGQMQAIKAGLTKRPLVLIQGPPGTGKTQTILGLLTAVIHARRHDRVEIGSVSFFFFRSRREDSK